ncbi:Rpn family recombination-promoting nuclease/putative transposase [Nostoc sp. UCD121]|uniref:Rpn family recombination-promoting nuclease/putative transposase n=1 Tax=unclassified Nostoc TaxID=2593658 RepID=UPI00162AA8FF|nr:MULTISPECIES: Rpn family recombination-promoting nuclease/putative transposase [unclassified Nostoc]MBC1218961.1 Rpn family recombination-promoting nuclease/putative transposase [Nostoc sp. UCD120]MBC1278438.1 Rpn family recombination-promoting nuclease/putative transposase [Nostoc sp. UCD121]MBC1297955.1 Rpn family recombination-promoting nuclease/putative transposase [Nostoc sp. UCD122]
MFDNVCRFLAESFSADFATWLLGESISLTQLSPSELSLEPIRADALILLQSDEIVLHIEFQTEAKAEIPFRMTDYRLRVYRRFPRKRMYQVVIYLQPSTSTLVQQTAFVLENTRHEFGVIRLWEQPSEIFLNTPGLLPFATLSQTEDKTRTLQQVAEAIEQINDTRTQSNIAASTAILAGLVLNKELIKNLLRSDAMRESVIYQDIQQEKALSIVLRLLRRKVGTVPPAQLLKIQALDSTQLDDLAEALLDFSGLSDLEAWLVQNQG